MRKALFRRPSAPFPALLLGLCAAAHVPGPLRGEGVPRRFYGAKFEPRSGVLHGAGQTYYRGGRHADAFERYKECVGDSYPLLYMDYCNSGDGASFYGGLKTRIERLQQEDGKYIVPQLGLVLPKRDRLADTDVSRILGGLQHIGRPLFLRLGYEANGPWNEYEPQTYVMNFRSIAERVREQRLPVAMVWNVVVGLNNDQLRLSFTESLRWYPGDDYVDWWSLNIFNTKMLTDDTLRAEQQALLRAADATGKPVMVGEATPQYTGADDAGDWEEWFEPYFEFIEQNPGIKAHAYINWDWTTTHPNDGWTDWGDCRLETGDATLLRRYQSRISDELFIHASKDSPQFSRR